MEQKNTVLQVNRLYKNNFFQRLFADLERLRDTVKLFSGKDEGDVQIANVKPILLGNKENDLSFLVGNVFYYMVEAQSTPNPNMPFRILGYITTALLQLVEANKLYEKELVKLKVPKLFTIFTGVRKTIPAQIVSEQRLSDAFEVAQAFPDLEVVVHAYDFTMVKAMSST